MNFWSPKSRILVIFWVLKLIIHLLGPELQINHLLGTEINNSLNIIYELSKSVRRGSCRYLIENYVVLFYDIIHVRAKVIYESIFHLMFDSQNGVSYNHAIINSVETNDKTFLYLEFCYKYFISIVPFLYK